MAIFRLMPFYLAMPALAHGAVEAFVETFDGNGPYESLTNDLVGFDNPGWEVYSDDGFAAGGFHFQNDAGFDDEDADVLERTLTGVGSFRMRVEINDLDLGNFNLFDPPDSGGQFVLSQRLHEDPQRGRNVITFVLQESWEEGPVWTFAVRSSANRIGMDVPRGDRVAIEITYDSVSSDVMFTYDNDSSDDVDPLAFGPLAYTGMVQETQLLTIISSSSSIVGKSDGVLDFLSVTPFSDVPGDFNGNGILDAADIDQLSEQVRSNANDPLYDLNADAFVNDLDRQVWVHDLKSTYFGDADLNGTFDSTDLVQVLASGEYEDGVALNSTWLTGDWDGDGDFTSGDLVVALSDGGYEAGATAAVPEPTPVLTMTAAAVIGAWRHRRSKTRRT